MKAKCRLCNKEFDSSNGQRTCNNHTKKYNGIKPFLNQLLMEGISIS